MLCFQELECCDGVVAAKSTFFATVIFHGIRLTPRIWSNSPISCGKGVVCRRGCGRIFLGRPRPLDAELDHSRAKRARIKSEYICRTMWSFNAPPRVLQSADNVLTF